MVLEVATEVDVSHMAVKVCLNKFVARLANVATIGVQHIVLDEGFDIAI